MLNLTICYLFLFYTLATTSKRKNDENDTIDFYFNRHKRQNDDLALVDLIQSYESFMNPDERSYTNGDYLNIGMNDFEAFSFVNLTHANESTAGPKESNETNNNLIGLSSIETAANFNEDKTEHEDEINHEAGTEHKDEINYEDEIDHKVNDEEENPEEEEILVINDSSSDIEIIQEYVIKQKNKEDDVTIPKKTINIGNEGVVLHTTIKDIIEQVIIQTTSQILGTDHQVIQEKEVANINFAVNNNEYIVNAITETEESFQHNDSSNTYSGVLD
ncbi:hypothetical protein NBO_38g0005 [Nosema bombycis CQ1]|uniref:Uncharacterized protein n=1 Tax=Nosema bombycis (strain CQ1 / CVCC 102059) TaxID=578461 RepID=R0M7X1_NOSB1|nr:hypothetical protein NBO_38g0005 [Nosema bombycis CQ1]|eukprot:EOB14094.1 hypothetical protein NBO_38g0005 [Nosema bombycis CQ1]